MSGTNDSFIGKTKGQQRFEQRVTFWGVRGTLPTLGTETLHYGGNTSCVEVQNIDHVKESQFSLVLDAGTGLANYGDSAIQRGQKKFNIILSHMHYDHIMGFLRFKPIFRNDCQITIYGQSKCGMSLEEIFCRFFEKPFFPLSFASLAAAKNIKFVDLCGVKELDIEGTSVQFHELNHPQEAIASRVWSLDRFTSVVYATDHEHGTTCDLGLRDFCKDASLLLYDSTYPETGFQKYLGWGHSTPAAGAKLAREANVGAYGLFHHDPESSDADLESFLLPEAKRLFRHSFLTVENQTICLTDLPSVLRHDSKPKVG